MPLSRTPSRKPTRSSEGDPFGNLGKTEWGLPTLTAIGTYAGLYALAKAVGEFTPFPLGYILQLLAIVFGCTAGETVYGCMTGGLRTAGFHRWVVCFFSAFLAFFVVTTVFHLVFGEVDTIAFELVVIAFTSACSALVSSFFGMFWLGVLDRMKGAVI